ncbi:AraC family transcriptional regulator [Paenibacillus sp. Soil787]|uniref:AraC family transcriptional regulator n=1 Tax=Paenibacillus sp. Soil787 TaxID=1736411 RepID=UPI0006F596F4|nr:helix-turn-helix domain-containing protein [Paenibacillus sp. Soil787]KRF42987.1 hypothetical protein ASG93_20775 [Paenibacillus sp. Soil787]
MAFPIKFRLDSLYTKLLLTFTVTVTLLIFGLSTLLYRNYSAASLENVNRMNLSVLNQIGYSVDYMDNVTQKFIITATAQPNIANLFFNPDESMVFLSSAFRSLNLLVTTNDYVYSAYTISLPLDRIVSTENGAYYYINNFYDHEAVDLVRKWDISAVPSMPIARRIPSPTSISGLANVYTYIIPYQTGIGEKPKTALVVNIKASVLRDIIASLNTKASKYGSDIFVIDSDGNLINHVMEDMFLRNVREEDYIRTVLASDHLSGSFQTRIGGQPFNVTYVSSNKLKWKFISLTSYKTFMSPVNAVKSSTMLISSVVLLLGLLFSVIMSKSLYSPIVKLTDTFRQRSDEFARKQRDQRQILKDNWLKEIILSNKNVGVSELHSKKEELGIRMDLERPMRIVLFRLDGYQEFLDRYNERDRRLLKFAVSNIIDDISSALYIGDVIDMDADRLLLLMESAESEEVETDLTSLVRSIQHATSDYLHLSLSATIGKPAQSLNILHEVYADTLALSLYRLIAGKGSILTTSFRSSITLNPHHFPEGKEKLLLDSLRLGHLDKAKKYYEEIMESVLSYTYENILSSVMHLIFRIKVTFPGFAENDRMFHDFFSNIERVETMEEINKTFDAIFSEIVAALDTTKPNRRQMIVNRIKKMVEEQYHDPNLNLSLLADEFQLSHVYLGRVFKESTGKSVIDYITEVRMARVKQLLNEASLSTKEILEQCGWEESNYFYILFKKHFGISLSHYKLMIDEKNLKDRV